MRSTSTLITTIFILFEGISKCFGEYYWKVSDDGKVIEAVPDSPYVLAYPGSLVDFLRQVESVKKFGKTYVELGNALKSINEREARDDPELEQRLRRENEHCTMGGLVSLDRENFKTSYSAEICPDFHKYYEKYIESVKEYVATALEDEKLLPHCRQWHREGHCVDYPKQQTIRSSQFVFLLIRTMQKYLKVIFPM
ncbi:hypothetical protein KIN20_031350 [Parelaphostrongylus tenuis]|uniref:Uncharacterized protein n=1 Tax=Parelaphostrongylus tenuis TaxID=148309 RepID=A0AAD5R510_PARTN|nr:hypothetical protein KIN20_031350 [Parelaphostrongylus tenuis]